MKHYKQKFGTRCAEEGAALITSIFALLLITVLGMALMAASEVARSVSTNDRENTQALYLADAGAAHARNLIFGYTGNFDAILTANATAPDTGDELSTALFASPITAGGHTFGSGSYLVRVADDDDGGGGGGVDPYADDTNRRLIVRSTGRGSNGSTSDVEIVISSVPLPALIVGGNLRISGNPEFIGAAGGVHANGNLQISGNPKAEDFFSASGTLTNSGSPQTGPPPGFSDNPKDLRSGVTSVSIPTITPSSFSPQADYILGTDGKIRDQAGTQLGSSGSWNSWDYDSSKRLWTNGGNSFPSGTYYAAGGAMKIGGNPGTSGSPITLSLIADAYVEISGNPTMTPDIAYAVIAGTDLKVNGNPTTPYTGSFYAGHQISFSGNPAFQGQVLAKNLADTSFFGENPVLLSGGYMEISGNVFSNFSGGGASVSTIASWREVRN